MCGQVYMLTHIWVNIYGLCAVVYANGICAVENVERYEGK